MRTSMGNKHVPAFLTKLWKLVEDLGCDDLISWSENGTSFVIHNDVQFAKELLPMYFKHNHMASFVRQLNMYGFRKLNHIEYGGMHYTSNEIEFYHQYFIKGQESLLKMIKRKVSNSRISEALEGKSGSMKDVALSIKNIKDLQQSTEKTVKDLKQQNAILWKQLAMVNERCVKQQRLLTELVPVFFDMVQPTPGLPNKRKAQLMIDDGLPAKKISRPSPPYLNRQKMYPHNSDSMPPSPFSISNSGPVIHDVTEMETKKTYADDILCSPEMPKDSEVFVHSPLSCKLENSERMLDCSFTDQVAMEPFNALNFRSNLSSTNEPIHEQPLRMVSSVPSPVVPYRIDVPDVKSATADNFSSFNSHSAVGSPASHSSPASLHSEVSCHSEFRSNEENIPAMKAVFESLSDQNSILSSSLMSDTCMNATAEVMPSTESFGVVTNTCSSPLLLTSNVQATPACPPVSSNQLNGFCESSVADSYATATCSPILPLNNNSHCAEGHSDKYKTECDADAGQTRAVQSILTSDTCMNATAEVMPSTESFGVVTNTCSSPLLLTSNVQATPACSPVSSNQLNGFCESSVADSYATATCSPILPLNNNSCCAESHSDKYKTECDADAGQTRAVQSILTSDNFSGTDRGGIDTTLNWLGNSDGVAESNMENWLGQLLRSEGIITGCDLDMSYNI